MALTRRRLLQVGAQAATLALMPRPLQPRPLLADFGAGPVPLPPITDPDVKELALRAVAAARSAGATYADVRLTHTYSSDVPVLASRFYGNTFPNRPAGNPLGRLTEWVDDERMHVGVRALVDGYWGFAASGVWTRDEMARLGQAAVRVAKANLLGQSRRTELAPTPVVADGHWVMPVKRDPFTMDPTEIYDVLASLGDYVGRYQWRGGSPDRVDIKPGKIGFLRQAKAFASSEGSYCTQELYRSQGGYEISALRRAKGAHGSLDFLSPAGVGWELYRDHDLQAEIWQLMDAIDQDLRMPARPIEPGRYDIAFDARAVAALVAGTLGRATELDRALGYEANATGTSYLNDPFNMVGSYPAGATSLTVTANRSLPGGAATVQWDDEGVAPEEFTLVKDGVLTDFHTTRESASWLAPYYRKQSRPVRSHGCAAALTAREAALTQLPNLAVTPGNEARDFDALVGGMKRGVAFKSWGADPELDMDFQCLNGLLTGAFYDVRDGRRVAKLTNAGSLLRAPELWKALVALGGPASVQRYGRGGVKGEPPQQMFHTVTAPPAVFQQLTLIDATGKA